MTSLLCAGLLSLTAHAATDYGSILDHAEDLNGITLDEKSGTLYGDVLSFRQLDNEMVTATFSLKGERLDSIEVSSAIKAGIEPLDDGLMVALTDQSWFDGSSKQVEGLLERGDETWYVSIYLDETATVSVADGALDSLGRIRYGLEAAEDAISGASQFYVALQIGDVYGAIEGAFNTAAGLYGIYLAFTDENIGWGDEPPDGSDLASDALGVLVTAVISGGYDLEDDSDEGTSDDDGDELHWAWEDTDDGESKDSEDDSDSEFQWAWEDDGDDEDGESKESGDDDGDSEFQWAWEDDDDDSDGCDESTDKSCDGGDDADSGYESNDPDSVGADADSVARYAALMAALGINTSPYNEDAIIERSCPGGICPDSDEEGDVSVLMLDIECDPKEEMCAADDDSSWINVDAVHFGGACPETSCSGSLSTAPVSSMRLSGELSIEEMDVDMSNLQSVSW